MKIKGIKVGILLLIILPMFIGCTKESVKEKPSEVTIEADEKVTNEEKIVNNDNKNDTVQNSEVISDYADTEYISYFNSRFGYSIKYPSFLTNKFEADNNDGIRAENDDKTVVFLAYGSNNIFEENVEEAFNNRIQSINNIVYKSLSDRSYIISWEEEGRIYYECSVIGSGAKNTFSIEYPKSDEQFFNSIVTEIYESFTPGDLTNSSNY